MTLVKELKWVVQFQDYVKWDSNKEGVAKVKARKKASLKVDSIARYSAQIEETMNDILNKGEFDVKPLPPQYDFAFGADAQVSYKKDDKNYSFFVDYTCGFKDNVKYFTLSGELTSDYNKAFNYVTEYFGIRLGIKERHNNFFFYEKPVVVICIDNYVPCSGIALGHITNITNVLISLHEMLMEKKGYGARASQKIRPNISKYYDKFEEYKKGK